MYSTSHHPLVSSSLNGLKPEVTAGAGTIDPAALNAPGMNPNAATANVHAAAGAAATAANLHAVAANVNSSPRGVKRSRSPEMVYGEIPPGGGVGGDFDSNADDQKPRKRGRPKKGGLSESPPLPTSQHPSLPKAAPALTEQQLHLAQQPHHHHHHHHITLQSHQQQQQQESLQQNEQLQQFQQQQQLLLQQQASQPLTPQLQHQLPQHQLPQQALTPQLQPQTLAPDSPVAPPAPPPQAPVAQNQSPKSAAQIRAAMKTLPTVRDHTTDQLSSDGDEYVPREYDEAGDLKVTPNGHPMDGREFRCRTFLVPNRGDKLFMLATECARVLGYRDSYLLFNKNRSLYKIIATQAEKDDLIHQEILPYSYRSRQIAIVTAKSMFRQFGSRVIVNGRRVRDDYWEEKARKHGFTEHDLPGEKRPGAAKARIAAAQAEAAAVTKARGSLVDLDAEYPNGSVTIDGQTLNHTGPPIPPGLVSQLPMIMPPNDETRYANVPRPRQEVTGPPYQDRIQPSSVSDIMNQAHAGAEFNKVVTQQRAGRDRSYHEFIKAPRGDVASPVGQHQPLAGHAESGNAAAGQTQLSSQQQSGGMRTHTPSASLHHQQQQLLQQPPMQHQQQQGPPSGMTGSGWPQNAPPPHHLHLHHQQQQQQQHHQQSQVAQSPSRGMPPVGSLRSEQAQHRSPALSHASHGHGPGGQAGVPSSPYGLPPQHNQMWHPAQPLQSPISQAHHVLPTYVTQRSPHMQRSPHQPPPPLHYPTGPPTHMSAGPMPYQGMPVMPPGAYPGGGRGSYTPTPNHSQYMHPSTATSQSSVQGWAPPPPPQHHPPQHASSQQQQQQQQPSYGWPTSG